MAERPKILCVDDEPRVLDGLTLQLGRSYEIHSATSGPAALEILRSKGPFAVVLSDMRMPAMRCCSDSIVFPY
ncbi:MAG: response regulator [Polyangiaceae bacterium]